MDEVIPSSARATSGMALGAEALDFATQRQSQAQYLKNTEKEMERELDRQGVIEEWTTLERENYMKTLKRDTSYAIPREFYSKTPLTQQEQESFKKLDEPSKEVLKELRGSLKTMSAKEFEAFIDSPPIEALDAVKLPVTKIYKAYTTMVARGYEPTRETMIEWAAEFTGLAPSSRALKFIINTILLRPPSEDDIPTLHRPILVLDPNKT